MEHVNVSPLPSAGRPFACPDLSYAEISETLKRAAAYLRISPAVVCTLQAMLSFLPPADKRTHNTVFASNKTLSERADVCERTLRYHCAALIDAGLMSRHDSANGKRFSRSMKTGKSVHFGFDLSPLFAVWGQISAYANQNLSDRAELASHITVARSMVTAALGNGLSESAALEIRKILRRKISISEVKRIIKELEEWTAQPVQAEEIATSGGKNCRHHNKQIKENFYKKALQVSNRQGHAARKHSDKENAETISAEKSIGLSDALEACPEIAEYASQPINRSSDLIELGLVMAPHIGISESNLYPAIQRLGRWQVGLIICIILQMGSKVCDPDAYFRSVTIGKSAASFCPFRWISNKLKHVQSIES